jgi:hypothetical protein
MHIAFPLLFAALLATPVAQPAAPMQIQSCSAQRQDYTMTPVGSAFVSGPTMNSAGQIVSFDPRFTDQPPALPMYGGTHVYGWAQAANRSGKAVSGVVYEFDVLSAGKAIAAFYGPSTQSAPWKIDVTQPKIDAVKCFVAFVRFSDGTSWLSPLATIPQAQRSSP